MKSKVSLVFLIVLSSIIIVSLTYFPIQVAVAVLVGMVISWIITPIYLFFKLAEGIDKNYYDPED